MENNQLTYSGSLVKQHDPDRFLLSMLLPASERKHLWALYALNYEISKTREVVTDTTLGLIRLQWWRDALDNIYNNSVAIDNEILPSLMEAVATYKLDKQLFENLICAREFDLEGVAPSSLDGLLNYALLTGKPLAELSLNILGVEDDQDTLDNICTGYGLTGLLRAVPAHAAQHRCYMPTDMLANLDMSEQSLYGLDPDPKLQGITKDVANHALSLVDTIKPKTRVLRIMKVMSCLYLTQIKNLDYNVFHQRMNYSPAFYHLRLIAKLNS